MKAPQHSNIAETSPQPTRAFPSPRLELVVVSERGAPASRALVTEAELIRIGSHPSNDVVVDDPRVSRFHCRIARGPSAWTIEDPGSLNGTAVDGVIVRDGSLPARECAIELGDSRILVRHLPSVEERVVVDRANCGDLYGASLGMRQLFDVIDRVAATDVNVLIEGESGTGKELVAGEIVRRGPRARKPFVIVDCGAISPSLLESELFGHVRGAFTGAHRDRVGAFETADGGTVFLDEIGELPMNMQPKLLRALEAREIRRVGETSPRRVDVRVIAATNRLLDREVNSGRFREDLFFRLSVVTVRVPPLRERLDDVELLLNVFLDALSAREQRSLFTPEVLADMRKYDWPGNVRELRNYVERSVVLREARSAASNAVERTRGDEIGHEQQSVDLDVPFRDAKERVIAEFERRYLAALLEWSQNNMTRAARRAQMDRMNLYRLVQRHGLRDFTTLKE